MCPSLQSDKLIKAFNYLDAAMFFVESGIAMEKDPHISTSSYTMFAETVELLKCDNIILLSALLITFIDPIDKPLYIYMLHFYRFVLKLRNAVDASAPAAEKDFFALW